jgi:hypothetical protein
MMNLKKHPVKLLSLLLSVSLLTACSKDKDDKPAYPKEVTLEYRITPTTSGLTTADILYTNETGGIANADGVSLPYSKKFKVTVDRYEVFGITVTTAVGGTLKTEILVNDKAVDTKTFSGTSYIHGITSYQFP